MTPKAQPQQRQKTLRTLAVDSRASSLCLRACCCSSYNPVRQDHYSHGHGRHYRP